MKTFYQLCEALDITNLDKSWEKDPEKAAALAKYKQRHGITSLEKKPYTGKVLDSTPEDDAELKKLIKLAGNKFSYDDELGTKKKYEPYYPTISKPKPEDEIPIPLVDNDPVKKFSLFYLKKELESKYKMPVSQFSDEMWDKVLSGHHGLNLSRVQERNLRKFVNILRNKPKAGQLGLVRSDGGSEVFNRKDLRR